MHFDIICGGGFSKEAMFVRHVLEFPEPGKGVPPVILRQDNEVGNVPSREPVELR